MFKQLLLTVCFVLCVSGSVWADDSIGESLSGNNNAYDINTHGGDIDANKVKVDKTTPSSLNELTSKEYVDNEDSKLSDKIDSNASEIQSNKSEIQSNKSEISANTSKISANTKDIQKLKSAVNDIQGKYATKSWVKSQDYAKKSDIPSGGSGGSDRQCYGNGDCPSGGFCVAGKCEGYGSCLVAGSQILMEDGGYKNVEDIQVGDLVKGPDNKVNKVLALEKPKIGNRGLYFINGELELTGDHPVLTTEGWKVANLKQYVNSINMSDEQMKSIIADHSSKLNLDKLASEVKHRLPEAPKTLKIGDKVITEEGTKEVRSIEHHNKRPKDEFVYEIALDGSHAYFADGYVVHNR